MSAEKIPIANIYYLLCYALGHIQETHYAQVRTENCDRVIDLLAKVLSRSTQQLVKRGLHRDYLLERERRIAPRGKILPGEDLRRPLITSLARTCEFDELSANILPNRIILSTLKLMENCPDLGPDLRCEIREIAGFFTSVAPMRIESRVFRSLHVHRNMRHYRFVLDICEFVHAQLLPASGAGSAHFRDFRRDEARMGALFEQFVFNFYAKELSTHRVSAPHIPWDLDPDRSTTGGLQLLPRMMTDICLEAPGDRAIIDCKFYSEAFQWNFNRAKFISTNLYQLFTYIKNQAKKPGWENVRGMLLYPVTGAPFDETVHLHSHSIRVVAIDLGQSWREISRDLLAIAGGDLRLGRSDGSPP